MMRRQAKRGLVEQQQARAAHQRAADREHLLLAAGKAVCLLAAALAEAREVAVDAVDVALHVAIAADVGAQAQVLHHRELHEQLAALRDVRDAQGDDLLRGAAVDAVAMYSTVPPVRRRRPEMTRSVVLLPAPFAPRSATIPPSGTSSETPSEGDDGAVGGGEVSYGQHPVFPGRPR